MYTMTSTPDFLHTVLRVNSKTWGTVYCYEDPSHRNSLMELENGYELKALGVEGSDYHVELHCGKVGFVPKNQVVADKDYSGKDPYPAGSRCIRASETRTHPIFVVEPVFENGIVVHEQPDRQSRELFLVGPLQPALILETLPLFYEVLLPGPTTGFVLRSQGGRLTGRLN